MSTQPSLFGRPVDTCLAGVTLPSGKVPTHIVRGRNADGLWVVAACDANGRKTEPLSLSVLPSDYRTLDDLMRMLGRTK